MGRILNHRPAVLFAVAAVALFSFLKKAPAQPTGRVMGRGLDTSAYDALPLFAQYSGRKGGGDVRRIDLRPFCPTPGDQGETGACAGFALGHGAMTVAYAIEHGLTGRTRVDSARFSAWFIYNMIKKDPDDCREYSEIATAFNFGKQMGNCPARVFEAGSGCRERPSAEQFDIAATNRLREAGAIFARGTKGPDKVKVIRNHLLDSVPVIISFEVRNSFQKMPRGESFWRPSKDERSDSYVDQHFLLVIGFDENSQSFEVMNSWGEDWADGGFARITYEQMGHYCLGAFRVVFPGRAASKLLPVLPEGQVATDFFGEKEGGASWMRGSFDLLRLAEDGRFIPEPVKFDPGMEVYRPAARSLPLGASFQLATSDLGTGNFAYVFSCDPDRQVKLHFPKTDRPNPSPSENAVVTIPDENTTLTLRKKGTDYLCILYTDKPIEGMSARLTVLRWGTIEVFLASFQKAFNDLLPPNFEQRTYSPDRMTVHGRSQPKGPTVLPIILQVWASGK